jgi:outer membrane protein OmpA-like peptidoglycan-associated protein
MKNRIFITLLLCAALPGLAQQPISNSSAQPGTSANQTPPSQPRTTSEEPSHPRENQDFWDGDDPGLAWLVLHPFASKQYVRRHVQTIHDDLSELDELTAANSKMIRDVDSRSQKGIQLASDKTNLAGEHALEATTKADLAHQMATAVNTRLSTVETKVGQVDQYKSAPPTEIRFRPGQTGLSKQAKDSLDEIATQLKNKHGYVIEVEGFSPGQGQAAIAKSRKVADSVVRYLVLNHEIPAYRVYVIGLGNGLEAKRRSGTRVQINVLKNDIEQVAQQ